MCGVLGYCDLVGDIRLSKKKLSEALETLSHRGQDASGEYYWQNVYFGHRRLSIIDLSDAAHQPFHFLAERVSIVFNGEIYNYKELAATLPSMVTSSDTEVILRGYLCFGTDFFKRLRGIFAFAIYDYREEDSIILYRDLAGVKPLYFIQEGNKFAFASEIKAFHKLFSLKPNESVLQSYLSIGYCVEPHTAFKSVRCCRPGECLTFHITSGRMESRIIDQYEFDHVNGKSRRENIEVTEGLLKQAINRNMVSDVAVSVSLSGGIDSSLIASYCSGFPAKLLNVRFQDDSYNESEIAKRYANDLNRTLEIIDVNEGAGIELLTRILLHFDQPYSDTSAIPFYFLSKAAVAHGKVLLGGDGGDEVHCGYSSFGWLPYVWQHRGILRKMNSFGRFVLPNSQQRIWNRLQGLVNFNKEPDLICEWNSWLPSSTTYGDESVFRFDTSVVLDMFCDDWQIKDRPFPVHLIYAYFRKRMLSDYLRKADMMSMMNGLEYRVPMLDEDLVKFSLSIPFNQRADLMLQKRILRKIHQGKYSGTEYKRPKTGFSIPIDRWLSKSDFAEIEESLSRKGAVVSEFINPHYIKFLFTALEENHRVRISRSSVYQRIIQLYSFQLFCERN